MCVTARPWLGLKAGGRNTIRVSYKGGKDKISYIIITASTVHITRKVEQGVKPQTSCRHSDERHGLLNCSAASILFLIPRSVEPKW